MSLDAIDAALATAKQQAGALVPATTSAPPVPATAVAPGRPISMADMLAQSTAMSVKAFLKVDKLAFLIGTDSGLHKEFDVEFRFDEAQPFFGLRWGSSPVKYARSLDRIVNKQNGRPWVDCIREAQAIDPKCRGDYSCVDVPFTVLQDIKAEDGKVLVSAGEKIGWTSSITNFKDFKDFATRFYAQIAAGELAEDALVRGKIKHVKRTGPQDYGALTFVDFEVVDNGNLN